MKRKVCKIPKCCEPALAGRRLCRPHLREYNKRYQPPTRAEQIEAAGLKVNPYERKKHGRTN